MNCLIGRIDGKKKTEFRCPVTECNVEFVDITSFSFSKITIDLIERLKILKKFSICSMDDKKTMKRTVLDRQRFNHRQ